MSFLGKKNAYHCDKCGAWLITIDIDKGVTPFSMQCKVERWGVNAHYRCEGTLLSNFYPPEPWPPNVSSIPEWEWYRPSKEEIQGYKPEYQEYYRQGGLKLRKILIPPLPPNPLELP